MSDEIDSLPIREKLERKVLIFGSAGVGKTTAIKTLCESFKIDDSIESVALACGKLTLSSSESLLFYATQSQDYSDANWTESIREDLKNSMIGIIFLIDNRRKDPFKDLETFLSKFSSDDRSMIVSGQIVIGITHVDCSRTPATSDYHSFLDCLDLIPQQNPPIFSVDTRNFQDMSMLLQALLYSQDPTMNVLVSEELNHS